METGKHKGRPAKTEGIKEVVGTRFNKDTLSRLDEIVRKEQIKTGYNDIDRSNVIRRAVDEFIDRYKD